MQIDWYNGYKIVVDVLATLVVYVEHSLRRVCVCVSGQ